MDLFPENGIYVYEPLRAVLETDEICVVGDLILQKLGLNFELGLHFERRLLWLMKSLILVVVLVFAF